MRHVFGKSRHTFPKNKLLLAESKEELKKTSLLFINVSQRELAGTQALAKQK
jgi:hypothetical protein